MMNAVQSNMSRAAVSAAACVVRAFRPVVLNALTADAVMSASAFIISALRLIRSLMLRISNIIII